MLGTCCQGAIVSRSQHYTTVANDPQIFNTTLTSDPKKIIYASRTNPSYVSSAYTEIQEEATKCIQDGLGDRSEFRKTMESSLLTFNQYATSIDVLVQHQPHVTALIWGAIRTLIQVSLKLVI